MRWFQKAADEGNAEAQFTLGIMYLKGENGLTPSETEGMSLLRKAARQGHPTAQRIVRGM